MSQETEEQLSELQSQLEQEAEQLQAERGRLDRQAASITDTMTTEAQVQKSLIFWDKLSKKIYQIDQRKYLLLRLVM